MAASKFDVPEIPPELVDECKRKSSQVWALADLDLRDPALVVTWARQPDPSDSHASMSGCYWAPINRMFRSLKRMSTPSSRASARRSSSWKRVRRAASQRSTIHACI